MRKKSGVESRESRVGNSKDKFVRQPPNRNNLTEFSGQKLKPYEKQVESRGSGVESRKFKGQIYSTTAK